MEAREQAKAEFVNSRQTFIVVYKELLEKLLVLLRSAKDTVENENARIDMDNLSQEVALLQRQIGGRSTSTVSDSTAGIQTSSESGAVTTRSAGSSPKAESESPIHPGSDESSGTRDRKKREEEDRAREENERRRKEQQEREWHEADRRKKEQEDLRRREDEERSRIEEEDRRREHEERERREEERRRKEQQEERRREEDERRRRDEDDRKRRDDQARRRREEDDRRREQIERELREREEAARVVDDPPMGIDDSVNRIVSAFYAFRYRKTEFRELFHPDQGDSQYGNNNNASQLAACRCPVTKRRESPDEPPWLRDLASATVRVLRRAGAGHPASWSQLAGECHFSGCRCRRRRQSDVAGAFDAIPPLAEVAASARQQAEAMLLALNAFAGRAD